jgi:hypothetical protein
VSDVVHDRRSAAPREADGSESAQPGGDAVIRPSGPAAAALLAAGVASFTLGVLTVLASASGSVSSALTLSERVGDLSGLTTATAIVFFGSWGVLHAAWRRADPPLMRVAAGTAVLIAVGLLGTFPPFVNAVGG